MLDDARSALSAYSLSTAVPGVFVMTEGVLA